MHQMEQKLFLKSYIEYCVYWYTSEALEMFLDSLGKIFHANFLGYAHWFMSIRISQMNYHSISVDHARYATSIVSKYLDTSTVKTSAKLYNTTLPSDMIYIKTGASTSDEQIEKLTREFNIYYRAFIGSLIYFVIYKSGFEFCNTQVRKILIKPW